MPYPNLNPHYFKSRPGIVRAFNLDAPKPCQYCGEEPTHPRHYPPTVREWLAEHQTEGPELHLQIYKRSITVPEHRQLRDAVDKAAAGRDGTAVTWIVDGAAERTAGIAPADLIEYALRHGWGR